MTTITGNMSDIRKNPDGACCPRGGFRGCTGKAAPPHTCPYAEEINDDHESLCECCDICAGECAADI